MGGQACVFYGAAEFSRDCDIVILSDSDNLDRLSAAAAELQAERIAFPEFQPEYLARGHAVHFRCHHPEADKIRLDVMTKMRGCEDFATLWNRRTSIEDEQTGMTYELLSIEDLVRAKKTQRDKDWPMVRRLVEAHHRQFRDEPTTPMIHFWLRELRTPELLQSVAQGNRQQLGSIAEFRPWLEAIDLGDLNRIQQELDAEEKTERELDAAYWRPLKEELARLRRSPSTVVQPAARVVPDGQGKLPTLSLRNVHSAVARVGRRLVVVRGAIRDLLPIHQVAGKRRLELLRPAL